MSEYSSVWDALSDTPAEAEVKKARSALMTALRDYIAEKGWTQTEAAKHFGVSQPRVSDLTRGKMSKFNLEGLMSMAANAGLHVDVRVRHLEPA